MALAGWASWDDPGAGCRSPIAAVGRNDEGTVVALAGELDIATQETLTQILAKAIAIDDADLVVDLSRVACIDVATIGVLVRGREFLRLRSRDLAVRAPSESVRRALEACGQADLIDSAAAASWFRVGIADIGSSRMGGSATETRSGAPTAGAVADAGSVVPRAGTR
jgi:anti-anti-sigma factor